jgi:hypothetical protein
VSWPRLFYPIALVILLIACGANARPLPTATVSNNPRVEGFEQPTYTPTPSAACTGSPGPPGAEFGLTFYCKMAPGEDPRLPPGIPYVFNLTGVNVAAFGGERLCAGLRGPTGTVGCAYLRVGLVVIMDPSALSGSYSVELTLPDGRSAQASFQHQSIPGAAPLPQAQGASPQQCARPEGPRRVITLSEVTIHFEEGVSLDNQTAIENGIRAAQSFLASQLGGQVTKPTALDVRASAGSQDRGPAGVYSGTICPLILIFSGDQRWPTSQLQRTQKTAHEYMHIFQNELSDGFAIVVGPEWVHEGGAEFLGWKAVISAGLVSEADVLAMYGIRPAEKGFGLTALPPLQSVGSREGFRELSSGGSPGSYALSYYGLERLTSKYGLGSLRTFWQRQATVRELKMAFESAFGTSLDAFYQEFEQARGTSAPPLALPPTATPGPVLPFAIVYEERLTPGQVPGWSPVDIPYLFRVTGVDLNSWTTAQEIAAFRLPPGSKGIAHYSDRANRGLYVVFLAPDAPPGRYTVGFQLPDRRLAETTFEHAP